MAEQHEMRVLVTGIDAAGKSCVVSERLLLSSIPEHPGFWMAEAYETQTALPPPRPSGRTEWTDVNLDPGRLRWTIIDYEPSTSYPGHITDTVDLDIVLRGSVELILDDGPHALAAGDAVLVTGVDHAWRGGPDGCRVSVTMLGTPRPGDAGS